MEKGLIKLIALFITLRTRWRANRLHFKAAIRKAEQRANQTGRRHCIYFLGGRYRMFTRKDVQRLKNKGVIRHGINMEQLQAVMLYDTQGHINLHPLYYNVTVRGIKIVYNPKKEQPCTLQRTK